LDSEIGDFDDKHMAVMEAILPYAKSKPQKNLEELQIENITRDTSIRFFLLPEWAPNFPPYNLARLVSVCKNAGYKSDAVDLNIKAYRKSKKWNLDFDPWHGSQEWRWTGQSYHNSIHKHLALMLEDYITAIEEDKIDVVGFTLYYCNQEPTQWMAEQIKIRYPHIKILVGGPQCHTFPPGKEQWYYDYVVSGEGEQLLLGILSQIEENNITKTQQVLTQPPGMRLNLDTMPMPDYSSFDISEYNMPNGVNTEFSRGCVAKCVFCSETHFWKFRGRSSSSLLNEVLTLNERYGIDFIWFLDSLVNGNIKELRAFCKGIIASGIHFGWTGYARCHKAMDEEYFDDLAASGCKHLSYGIESGSDKVLEDMDKKITVDIIERNLELGHKVGIQAHTNWIVGFPTEKLQDIYESLTLCHRNSDYLQAVATGHGFTEPPDTIVSQNSTKYGMLKSYYLDNWISSDFTSSKLHRMLRLIYFNILLENTTSFDKKNTLQNFDTTRFCSIDFKTNKNISVEYEKFNFDIIDNGPTTFANSLMNEVWPLMRLLWRSRGAFDATFNINPSDTYQVFGDRLAGDVIMSGTFNIDRFGNFTANFNYSFKQPDNAWRYVDYSNETSIAAQNARIQSIPGNKGEIISNFEESRNQFLKDLDEHRKIDFTFNKQISIKGRW